MLIWQLAVRLHDTMLLCAAVGASVRSNNREFEAVGNFSLHD